MAEDPFQDLLELEDEFYKEGFEAGVADSAYAGMIEGKVFGVEKGYEKALELAKMHGRAIVWTSRIQNHISSDRKTDVEATEPHTNEEFVLCPLDMMQTQLGNLPSNSRLQKHIENLSSLTDGTTMRKDNSDESVTEFDGKLAKARAKAKIISSTVGEPLNPVATFNSGIEDATGLNARQ